MDNVPQQQYDSEKRLIEWKIDKRAMKPLSGAGAPTSTPRYIGDIYIDTTNGSMYMAVGTSGSYNWGYVGSGGLTADYTTNLTSWYDASDSLTPNTNGSTLTGWNDKGSQVNHLTTIGGTPKCYTNIQNGLSAAYFDGDNDYLTGTNKDDAAQPQTYFLVFKPTGWGTGGYQHIVSMMNSAQLIGKVTGNTQVYCQTGVTTLNGASLSDNTTALITVVFNGASSSIQANDIAKTTGNAGTTVNTNNPRIGNGYDGTVDYTGYVMEWRIYSEAMSDANIAIVKAALNAKWAIY